jgi:hypothetical protein
MSVKTGKEAAISGLLEYRQELIARLMRLKADLEAVEHSLALLGGANGDAAIAVTASSEAQDVAGPQDVVEAFLKAHLGRFFKPSVAARLIRRGGYIPKNLAIWSTQVGIAMKRLRDKGIVLAHEEEGKRVFGVPEETQGPSL